MQKDNQEMMDQIKQDAIDEIREVEKKNQTNLNQVTDMSLRSKADLQITKNKLHDVRNELKTLGRLITDKSMQLDKQKENISNLNRELQQKKDQVKKEKKPAHLVKRSDVPEAYIMLNGKYLVGSSAKQSPKYLVFLGALVDLCNEGTIASKEQAKAELAKRLG